MWLICLLICHVDVAHGYFAYVNEISFAYPEHVVHEGVARLGSDGLDRRCVMELNQRELREENGSLSLTEILLQKAERHVSWIPITKKHQTDNVS